jgi:hypothetical protein
MSSLDDVNSDGKRMNSTGGREATPIEQDVGGTGPLHDSEHASRPWTNELDKDAAAEAVMQARSADAVRTATKDWGLSEKLTQDLANMGSNVLAMQMYLIKALISETRVEILQATQEHLPETVERPRPEEVLQRPQGAAEGANVSMLDHTSPVEDRHRGRTSTPALNPMQGRSYATMTVSRTGRTGVMASRAQDINAPQAGYAMGGRASRRNGHRESPRGRASNFTGMDTSRCSRKTSHHGSSNLTTRFHACQSRSRVKSTTASQTRERTTQIGRLHTSNTCY